MCEAAPPVYFHPYQVVFPARTPDTDMPAIFLSAISAGILLWWMTLALLTTDFCDYSGTASSRRCFEKSADKCATGPRTVPKSFPLT